MANIFEANKNLNSQILEEEKVIIQDFLKPLQLLTFFYILLFLMAFLLIDWIFLLNLVTRILGQMQKHSAGARSWPL